MKNTKKAFWILYVFFLIAFILSFWLIILNKQSYFEKNIQFMQINDMLDKNISSQANISLSRLKEGNKNNWLFIPILSCPQEIHLFSGSELVASGNTIFQDNYCSGALNQENLLLFYTGSYDQFSSGTLWGTWFELLWENTLTGDISPYSLVFEKPNYFDTRFIDARLEHIWILLKNNGWQNIFWNHKSMQTYINDNTNNILPFELLWNTQSWVLYLDVSDSFSGKIITFDRELFETQKKLLKTDEIEFSRSWGVVWYLQEDLSFSTNRATAKIFDFKNNDYGVFLSYHTWSLDNIRYTLKVFTQDGTWVYINPIKDDTSQIEYLWNHIFFYQGVFYNKLSKIFD